MRRMNARPTWRELQDEIPEEILEVWQAIMDGEDRARNELKAVR